MDGNTLIESDEKDIRDSLNHGNVPANKTYKVYIYMYIYVCIHIFIYTYVYIYMYIYI
jgi:hypothetical protein